MESDDQNFQDTKIPSYVIVNMSIASKFDKFFSTLKINNIFNEKYYNYAVASSSTLGAYNAYPETRREIILSLGTKF
jgi:iron complex outermembrane receptor protein